MKMHKQYKKKSVFGVVMIVFLFLLIGVPLQSPAADDVEELKQELQSLGNMMKTVQQKLETLEKQNASKEEEVKEMDKRLNKA
ncbi:MAG TPA: hypothetical protein VLP30_08495, partial [Desulfatirhabdiaceae bacterium]|nr:hypothetical protein [Desulfatirhabdiaceae bacterium]